MRHLVPLIALVATSLAACDPVTTYDPGRSARPNPELSSQPARPATIEAALNLCDPNAFDCTGDNTLQYCGASGITQQSCATICASAGYTASLGCGFEASLGGDACFCDNVQSAPAPSCLPGWACSGDLSLSYCSDATIETWNCDSVCRSAGYASASACDYDDRGEATC
jgi:hypothetical protein